MSTTFPEEKIMLPGQTPEGHYILSVLVKRTYDITPTGWCVRTQPKPLIKGDQFYDNGDPRAVAMKFETDLIPFKLATDVIFLGKAYAPAGQKVSSLMVSLLITAYREQYRKDLLVIGDRECVYNAPRKVATGLFRRAQAEPVLPTFTDPIPFSEMEIRYERAYGGVDIYSNPDLPAFYPRNLVGKGFVLKNTKQTIQNLALPNLEDPKDLLTPERLLVEDLKNWEHQPMPQGFGWYNKYCYPRAALVGILPADKKYADEMRAVYRQLIPPQQLALYDQTELPVIDFRFFNGASLGLVLPYLWGDEKITLFNLDPQGRKTFSLPSEKPQIVMDIGEGEKVLEVVLHTLTIHNEENQLDMLWRGAMPYPGPEWLPQMKKLLISIT